MLRSVTVLALWTGCTSETTSSVQSSTSTAIDPTVAIPLHEWPKPRLEVLQQGIAPHETLHVPLNAVVPSARVVWDSTFSTTATRGAVTTTPSRVRQSRTLAIALTPGSPATFDFVVTAAQDRGTGGTPIDPAVATALEGRQGRWTADAHCQILSAGIDDSNAGPAAPHLPGLLRTAAEYCPILPEAPLGIGAVWRTTEARADGRTTETEWVLSYRDEQQVALTFQTRSPDPSHTMLAEGRVGLDRHHPTPVRFDAKGRTTRTRPDPERPGKTLDWTTVWEMHAERTIAPSP